MPEQVQDTEAPLWIGLGSDQLSSWYRISGLSCDTWHQGVGSRSTNSCGLESFLHVPQMLARIGIWGIWRPNQDLELIHWVITERFLQCLRARCPEGSTAIAMKPATWSTAVFVWVVHVKWHPHEFQDPRSTSRNLHCNETVNVIHFTCRSFNFVAVWCQNFTSFLWLGLVVVSRTARI